MEMSRLTSSTEPVQRSQTRNVLQGDACEKVKEFESGSFNFIIHDPPARALSRTDIYGLEFYSQLRRVLTNDGSLFHYIGTVCTIFYATPL
jgi:predicted methyltransferase